LLVPVATTILLSRFVVSLSAWYERTAAREASGIVVAALAAAGVWIGVARLGFHTSDTELPLLNFVRKSREPGQLYFLPVSVPDLVATTRGSLSSDFKPLRAKQQDSRVIPVDLQRFRLYTGVPIYVDFKSIPYRDTEVLEWEARLRQAQSLLHSIQSGSQPEALAELRRLKVTHLVLPLSVTVKGIDVAPVYQDETYRVYRLAPGPER
jgi:hypothetical protein